MSSTTCFGYKEFLILNLAYLGQLLTTVPGIAIYEPSDNKLNAGEMTSESPFNEIRVTGNGASAGGSAGSGAGGSAGSGAGGSAGNGAGGSTGEAVGRSVPLIVRLYLPEVMDVEYGIVIAKYSLPGLKETPSTLSPPA